MFQLRKWEQQLGKRYFKLREKIKQLYIELELLDKWFKDYSAV